MSAAALILCLPAACARVDVAEQTSAIQAISAAQPAWAGRTKLDAQLWKGTQAFYEARQHRAAWIEGDQPTPRLTGLVQELRRAEAHGLDPAAYGIEHLTKVLASSKTRFRGTRIAPGAAPELDVRLTYAYLQYAADLLGWRHSPREVNREWQAPPREEDLVARLEGVVSGGDLRESLEALAPSHPQYKGLQVALADLRQAGEGARTLPARSDAPPVPEDAEARIRMNMDVAPPGGMSRIA